MGGGSHTGPGPRDTASRPGAAPHPRGVGGLRTRPARGDRLGGGWPHAQPRFGNVTLVILAIMSSCKDEILVEYVPGPTDASGITLPEELRQLTELLAKNAHENWARQRLADGWRYGPERNDTRKEHPDLVP